MMTWGAFVPASEPDVVCEKEGDGGRLNPPPPTVDDVLDRRESSRGRLDLRSYAVAMTQRPGTTSDEKRRSLWTRLSALRGRTSSKETRSTSLAVSAVHTV
jgi:hypothetical protein